MDNGIKIVTDARDVLLELFQAGICKQVAFQNCQIVTFLSKKLSEFIFISDDGVYVISFVKQLSRDMCADKASRPSH